MLLSTIKRSLLTSRSTHVLKPSVRWATQDYGSGKGDPKGEKPQDQGANPSADKEHPGAPPPKEGEGSGGSPTKGTSTGHNTGASKQGQAQKRQFSTVRTLWAEDRPKSTEGLNPKILDERAPAKHEQGEDAKKHNEEMEGRTDRAHEQVDTDNKKDNVDSKFWSGQGSLQNKDGKE